tara:strand:- start:1289 stop:2827 length:1539 start_codon:yes stop_codon:yes gene_type:complete
MIKSIRDLSDNELLTQCEKYNLDHNGLHRAQKIRSLSSKGVKSVYVPIEPTIIKKNVAEISTQTFLRQQEVSETTSANNEEFKSVSAPIQSSKKIIRDKLTTNVVVTDAVYSNLAIQKNIYINGQIYLRDRSLNPIPSIYTIDSNNQVIYIDFSTDDYTFNFECNDDNTESTITLTHDSKLNNGNKGIIKCINKTKSHVKVKFDSDTLISFAIDETQTLSPLDQFSFEYCVIENESVSVNFIEETVESRSHIVNRTSISEFKEFQTDNGVKLPSEYHNSLLVAKPENDGTPGLQWQYLNYFEPLTSLENNLWIHYFKHYYTNYKIIVSDSYEYLTIINEFGHILLGYFGYINANENESEGMHGYIHIKNERSSSLPLYIGFHPYDWGDVLDDNSKASYGWSASFIVSQSSFSLSKNQEILLQYTVVRTGANPMIIAKQINIYGNIPPTPIDHTELSIIHVTYEKGKFKLFDHSNQQQLTTLKRGRKYRFIYQDTSYNQHLLRFSNRNDGYFL